MNDLATITILAKALVNPVLSKSSLNNYLKVIDNISEVAGYSFRLILCFRGFVFKKPYF
jgi:hypothetical protein